MSIFGRAKARKATPRAKNGAQKNKAFRLYFFTTPFFLLRSRSKLRPPQSAHLNLFALPCSFLSCWQFAKPNDQIKQSNIDDDRQNTKHLIRNSPKIKIDGIVSKIHIIRSGKDDKVKQCTPTKHNCEAKISFPNVFKFKFCKAINNNQNRTHKSNHV